MKFLIISRARSGSHMLSSMLDSHPDLTCFGEAMDIPWLDRLQEGQGAMIKYNHVHDQALLTADSPFRLIHLVRKDLLELAISNLLLKHAVKTGGKLPYHKVHTDAGDLLIWDCDRKGKPCKGEKTPGVLRVERTKNRYKYTTEKQEDFPIELLTPVSLSSLMSRLSDEILPWHQFLKDKALTVFYEDIVGSSRETSVMPESVSRRICKYLGVAQHAMTTPFKKVNKYEQRVLPRKIRHLNLQLRNQYLNALLT